MPAGVGFDVSMNKLFSYEVQILRVAAFSRILLVYVSMYYLKLIHQDIFSAYFFLIVDFRERGTLLLQENGLKKSQAQKI